MKPYKFKQFVEQFTRQAARMSRRQRADLADRLNRSLLQEKTAALIEAAGESHRACPRCRSQRLHRHGHAHGLQRYRCVDCGRTFNALTGTPLARLLHRSKWLPYLDAAGAAGNVAHLHGLPRQRFQHAAAFHGIHAGDGADQREVAENRDD